MYLIIYVHFQLKRVLLLPPPPGYYSHRMWPCEPVSPLTLKDLHWSLNFLYTIFTHCLLWISWYPLLSHNCNNFPVKAFCIAIDWVLQVWTGYLIWTNHLMVNGNFPMTKQDGGLWQEIYCCQISFNFLESNFCDCLLIQWYIGVILYLIGGYQKIL